jgi:hypothetical protein
MSRYTSETLHALEVRAKTGKPMWYYVTLYHYQNLGKDDVEYFKDWIEWDGKKWLYGEYVDCYVCFLHDKKDR